MSAGPARAPAEASRPGGPRWASRAAAAARALRALERADSSARALAAGLAPVLDGWRRATGRAATSRLSRTGSPLDLAFVWPAAGVDVRATADPAPGATAAARLRRCLELAGPLAGGPAARALAVVLGWQSECGGRYGAWVGVRASQAGPGVRLYVEVPAGAPWRAWEAEVAGAAAGLAEHGVAPAMLGLDPGTGRLELYYRAGRLHAGEVELAARRVGLPGCGTAAVDLLGALAGRLFRRDLPSADLGFSAAWSPAGEPVAFSLFSFAHSLLGGDRRIRAAVLGLADSRGWDAGPYRELSAPLADGTGFATWHGMAGALAAADGTVRLQVGLAPPGTEA